MSNEDLTTSPGDLHTHDPNAVATHRVTAYTTPRGDRGPECVITDLNNWHVRTVSIWDDEHEDDTLARAGFQRIGAWNTTHDKDGRWYCEARMRS